MVRPRSYYGVLFAACVLAAGCEKCAPGTVGQGVSRLTIRNFGAMLEVVNSNTDCGFSSERVLSSAMAEGPAGGLGTVTWTVTDCAIDIPAAAPLQLVDCNGAVTEISGSLTYDARKIVGGTLTGDSKNPVIPGSPTAATFKMDNITFRDFDVRTSSSLKFMIMKSGSISGQIVPMLAVAESNGVCSIPTRHVAFADVSFGPSVVRVVTDSRDFEVGVDGSNLYAANGTFEDRENELFGDITVWGSHQNIPTSGDDDGLDPDYDPNLLVAGYACKDDLMQPPTFVCEDAIGPALSTASARLTIRTLGAIAGLLEADATCGFSSPSALQAAEVIGDVGRVGTVTLRSDACTITLPPETVIKTNCAGTETIARGSLVVSGTKTITGRLTGDLATPAIPMSDSPAQIEIDVQSFDSFEVREGDSTFEILSGALSGRVVPRVAADTTNSGACAFASPIARFQDVSYEAPAQVRVTASSGSFQTQIDGATLDALNGTWGEQSNLLEGQLILAGEVYGVPSSLEDTGLNPDFDQSTFDASWQCAPELEQPIRHACEFSAPLAQGASQLTIQMFGKLVELVNSDDTCGFSSPGVVLSAVPQGEVGFPNASIVYSIDQPCVITLPERTEISRDCNGKRTYASGRVRLTGTKTVEGFNTGHPTEPVVPTTRDGATLVLDAVLEDFAVWTDPEANILHVHSGRLTGSMAPRLAIDRATGACSLSTPVAAFSSVSLKGAEASLFKDGLQFDLSIAETMLQAFNGNHSNGTNRLQGTIDVDGDSYSIPVAGDAVLDPEFSQAAFDQSYQCDANLQVPNSDAQCSLTPMIGHGAARLIALTVGAIAGQVNGNDDCGFENFWVKTDPSNVVGDSGDIGLLEWDIEDCTIERTGSAALQPYDTDCLLRDKFYEGSFTVDAHRTVRGLRESELLLFDSIIPQDPNSVDIDLLDVELSNFVTWEVDPGTFEPLRRIAIQRGNLSATVHPITAERADEAGVFDVSTPVAHMTSISLQQAPVTIEAGGRTFRVEVTDANFEAFNGSFSGLGMTNYLAGTITIDGQVVQLGGGLDPDYTQTSFDARYACYDNLGGLIPQE